MRCEAIIPLLHPYLDGELSEESVELVSRHLLGCAACAHEAHGLNQTRSILRASVEASELSDVFIERTSARLRDKFAHHLRSAPRPVVGRQWILPFVQDERASGTD